MEADRALELAKLLRPGMPREVAYVEKYARMMLGVLFNLRGQAHEASREWQLAIAAARAAKLKALEYRC